MAIGSWDVEWQAVTDLVPGVQLALTAIIVVVVAAAWAGWRHIVRLKAANLALDERLRLAQNSQAEAIQKLTIAEARFQELYARIKASEGFMSLNSPAKIVAHSISELGRAQNQLAAALAMEPMGPVGA